MHSALWKHVAPYFRPDSPVDRWGDPSKMDAELILGLYELRAYVGKPLYVLCGWELRGPESASQHPLGRAVDVYSPELHWFDLFLAASRFDVFNGLGVYTWWRGHDGVVHGGVHLDTRPGNRMAPDALWCSPSRGTYEPIGHLRAALAAGGRA